MKCFIIKFTRRLFRSWRPTNWVIVKLRNELMNEWSATISPSLSSTCSMSFRVHFRFNHFLKKIKKKNQFFIANVNVNRSVVERSWRKFNFEISQSCTWIDNSRWVKQFSFSLFTRIINNETAFALNSFHDLFLSLSLPLSFWIDFQFFYGVALSFAWWSAIYIFLDCEQSSGIKLWAENVSWSETTNWCAFKSLRI